MAKVRRVLSGLTFRLIMGILLVLLVANILCVVIGYASFSQSFTAEYGETAYHTAITAARLVDGNRISDYLNGNQGTAYGNTNSYRQVRIDLERLRSTQGLNAVYVVTADRADYEHITSVFNTVNPEIYPSVWRVGEVIPTEKNWAPIYRDLYENGLGAEEYYVVEPDGVKGSVPFVTAFYPITNDKGQTTALMCVQRPMNALVEGHRTYLINVSLFFILIALFTVILMGRYISHSFLIPLKRIMGEAERFSQDNTMGDESTFVYKSRLGEITEISHLYDTIQQMESDTVQNISNLQTLTAEQERLDTELSLAKTIQANALPNLFPPFPEHTEFDIFATMTPAKTVGGDFYDFYKIDDDHLAVLIADVSGKGIPAALFMMSSKIRLKSHSRPGLTPAQILAGVNREICAHNVGDMFVTVWLGILTISTGEMIAANAGHEYPIIGRADGRYELYRDRHGFVLGGLETSCYRDYTFTLHPGDSLFIYTDGITEASNSNQEMYGTDRLLETLNRFSAASMHEVFDRTMSHIEEFVGDAVQFDDMTMLALKMIDPARERRLDVEPSMANMAEVSAFLEQTTDDWNIPAKVSTTLQIVLDEVYSNIIHYSRADSVMIKLHRTADHITLVLADDGEPYDPTTRPDPDITLSAEDRSVGGLGIYMVKQMMDRVIYKHPEARNILIMQKNL